METDYKELNAFHHIHGCAEIKSFELSSNKFIEEGSGSIPKYTSYDVLALIETIKALSNKEITNP